MRQCSASKLWWNAYREAAIFMHCTYYCFSEPILEYSKEVSDVIKKDMLLWQHKLI